MIFDTVFDICNDWHDKGPDVNSALGGGRKIKTQPQIREKQK